MNIEELLIKHVSKNKNINVAQASEYIQKCIYKVASQYSSTFDEIKDLIYESFENMLKSKPGSSDPDPDTDCHTLSLEECANSKCAIYKNKCIPRKIKDAEIINRDPDKYVKSHLGNTKDLEEVIELASYLYHNFEGGGLTENSFDSLEYHLNKRLKTKERRKEKIGAPPVDKIRIKLPYFMPSLNKVKPNTKELNQFLSTPEINDKPTFVYSTKLDGVSGMIIYKNGAIVGVYLRGDGEIGGDITYIKDYIKLPEISGLKNLVIRGEFVINKILFEQKYKSDYVSPRSFVSSKLNSGFISPYLIDVEFLAYEIIDPRETLPINSFQYLASLGFKIPAFGFFDKAPRTFDLMMLYKKYKDEYEYDIDGIVLTKNIKVALAKSLQNPEHSVAFKMQLEAQIRESKIIDVDWNISRHGKYIPVAVFNSVYINDFRLHRATAHNAAHVRDWSLGVGTQVEIVRSGDVIPQIYNVVVDESIDPIYPTEEKGSWYWSNKDIVLHDIENNRWVQIKRNLHFFEVIGVRGMGPKTIELMWDSGLKCIYEITNATKNRFLKLKGFGAKKSETLFENIHKTMRKTRIDRFIEASTTFKSSIGRKLVIRLMNAYPTILNDDETTIQRELKKKKIKGFGEKRIVSVSRGIQEFKEFLKTLNKEDTEKAIEYHKKRIEDSVGNKNPKINNKLFVLTGFMKSNYDLEDYIYDNGGDIISATTTNTECVIANNVTDITQKMLKAYELKIPVFTIEEFNEEYM